MMIKGTHNSLTSYKLVGWQRLFCWLINLICRCQTKTIDEQLASGVRWFNLQVNLKDGRWIGSHGIAWYDIDVLDAIAKINACGEKCYVQIYLDKHFGVNTDHYKFLNLIDTITRVYPSIVIQRAYNEQNDILVCNVAIDGEEKYWTMTWADKWWKKIPIPKLWWLFYSKKWSKGSKEYLMNDFV